MQTPERKREYQKEYYQKNKIKLIEDNKKYYKKNKVARNLVDKKRNLKYKYNLSLEEYHTMFTLQEGKCALCGRHQNQFKKPLSVDHCHTTGKIRKLLCGFCNCSLGIYELYKNKFEFYIKNNE